MKRTQYTYTFKRINDNNIRVEMTPTKNHYSKSTSIILRHISLKRSTSNCQMTVMGDIEHLLQTLNNTGKSTKKELTDLFKMIPSYLGIQSRLILIDVHERCEDLIRSGCKPGGICLLSKFKSTNGSNRMIVILNTTKI